MHMCNFILQQTKFQSSKYMCPISCTRDRLIVSFEINLYLWAFYFRIKQYSLIYLRIKLKCGD